MTIVWYNLQEKKVLGYPPLLSHLGLGVFETIRLRNDTTRCYLPFLDRHIQRLIDGASFLSIKISSNDAIKSSVLWIIEQVFNPTSLGFQQDTVVRLVCCESGLYLMTEPWVPRYNAEKGVKICTIRGNRPMPQIKSFSAIVSVMANREAKNRGYDEALLVGDQGIATECAWSNFFWINKDRVLITPSRNILLGVTRSVVIDAVREHLNDQFRGFFSDFIEADCPVEEVKSNAIGAFITNSLSGLVRVNQIDEVHLLTRDGFGPLRSIFAQAVNRAVI